MKHDIHSYCFIHLPLILFKSGTFHAAHGSGRATESCILRYRIIIVELATAYATLCFSCKIIVQEPLMWYFLHAPPFQCCKIQSPANVIVTPQIIQESIFLRQAVYNIHLSSQKFCILHCHTAPCGRHSRYIIEHMAFRLFHRTKIRHYLFRFHDYFTKKQDTWAHDLTDHTHHTHNCMHLRKIPALCPQLFPDIRYCINTDNIHPLVGEEQEIIHHFIKYARILIVQVPLIWVKRRHYIVSCIRKICKVARSCCRKYLGNSLFISPWNIIVIIKEIATHIFAVSLPGADCPLMVFRCMIHDKIHTQVHSLFMARI